MRKSLLAFCEWASLRIHSLLFPSLPKMTLCAHAWWRRDVLGWRIAMRVFDVLAWLYEANHCRSSYERRFPK